MRHSPPPNKPMKLPVASAPAACRQAFDGCWEGTKGSTMTRLVLPLFGLAIGAALMHESVRDTHGTFWRPDLLPADRLGLRLAQLSHPVQYVAPDPCLPLLRFVAARAKAVSERPLVPGEKILDRTLSAIP